MIFTTKFLTDFADQAVILPLVIAITIALIFQGWWRGAFAWIMATAGTFSIMLALKLGFLACSPTHVMRSPSGHVAAATVVAGGLAILLLRVRSSALPLAILTAIVIGISRVVLGMHSVPEVALGAIVGFLGAVSLVWLAGPVPETVRVRYLALLAMFIVIVMHGFHLPAEAHVRRLAMEVRHVVGCQVPQASRPAPPAPAAATRH
jgi:membrane-associated phospholipid phosphatase